MQKRTDRNKSLYERIDREIEKVANKNSNKEFQSTNETLKNIGIEEINPVGEVFDPNIHEAIFQTECDDVENSGKIQSVFKKGYSLNGKMIRYAQVVVYK